MSYPLPSDPRIAAYLQHLRERNVEIANKCHYCKEPTIGINSDGYRVIFVCQDHYIPDNDKVVHRVYPEGKPVDPNMMDPNIGGKLSPKKLSGIEQEAIWASQISFEE